MSNLSHDEFLSDLYRETRAIEPPEHLEQRILAAAELPPAPITPRLPQRRFVRNWTLPLSLAATVVLAIGLIRILPTPVAEMHEAPAAHRFDRAGSVVVQPADPRSTLPASPARAPAEEESSAQMLPSLKKVIKPDAAAVPGQEPKSQRSLAEWLAEIAELRRQGRTAEAAASLAELRRYYPGAALDVVADPP